MGKYLDMADAVMGLKAKNQGRLVEFDSPLFGRCYGRIREVKANLYKITNHSVLQDEAVIPGAWLVRVMDDDLRAHNYE